MQAVGRLSRRQFIAAAAALGVSGGSLAATADDAAPAMKFVGDTEAQ
jgi:hypothetical protein